MNRLSLKRYRCERMQSKNVSIEVSDDDSTLSLSTNDGPASISCTSANISTFASVQDLSEDSSSSQDVVIIEDIPSSSNRKQPMFNWTKGKSTWKSQGQYDVSSKENTSVEATFREEPNDTFSKKRKVMIDSTESNDDNLANSDDSKKKDSPSKVSIQYDIKIAGINIKFPVKPYSCQKAVMNQLILGCTNQQNCLLESPTGSGKTLALLCGALAWQEQLSDKIRREEESQAAGIDNSCCGNDESFEEWCEKTANRHKAQPKVPKIYYGTRTHRQIEQVVREFKKTAYKHKRMTVLSSRDHTCIQNTKRNKTELCNELLDPTKHNKCPYYNEQNKKDMASFDALKRLKLETPWDIEDLVSLGRSIEACPYFAARSLMTDAEIIFCPYNYIVDPAIRESMQINLRDDIIILDEAHNIEDICREVAGVNLRDDHLAIAARECRELSYQRTADKDIYHVIQIYLLDVVKFLNKSIDVQENGYRQEKCSLRWYGGEFLEMLNIDNIGSCKFAAFVAASKAAIQDFDEVREETRPERKMKATISRDTKIILEHLCYLMQTLVSEALVNDFGVYVTETHEYTKIAPENTWMPMRNPKQLVRTMKLICMNPGVVFEPLAAAARSVILASGTLSPTLSFRSELNTPFKYLLNGNHIIPKEQLYIRCISQGPNKKSLIANYENMNSWDFQDELGNLILQVCDSVPYGVLCFVSSYYALSKLRDRWQINGIWNKLATLKQIFVEPRQGNELPTIIDEYRNVIKESSSVSFREASGAIFFAVFRGKVSEGIDFSDNEARCVLTIGIPYVHAKNADVAMKMKYNDSNTSTSLLSGSQWYTVNAFRALNQALGRCVRHINDWGALLLVDERLQKQENIAHLPKWVKTMCFVNKEYNLQEELENFVANQVARDRGRRCLSPEKIEPSV